MMMMTTTTHLQIKLLALRNGPIFKIPRVAYITTVTTPTFCTFQLHCLVHEDGLFFCCIGGRLLRILEQT